MSNYAERLRIPIDGDNMQSLCTRSGQLIATGYARVVIGGRGPYVEFAPGHLQHRALRPVGGHYYYRERRTTADNVKVYLQVHRVDYADYVPGKYYISPFDLFDVHGIAAIATKPKRQGELW